MTKITNLPLMRASGALLVLLCATSVQAAMLQISDVERWRAVREKLITAQVDITDAMVNAGELKNHVAAECLFMIHNQADSVSFAAEAVGTLTALSIMMKDSGDELQVLRALRIHLTAMSERLPHARKQINAWMTRCGTSATVNVKAQAVLNVLAEFENPVASLSRRAVQSKQ